MFKKGYIWFIAVAIILLSGCDGYSKLLKSTDRAAQLAAAETFYKDGNWGRARQLLEALQLNYRDRSKMEDITWMLATCQLKQRDYYLAAYGFTTFLRQYPYSTHCEEALFNAAYCKYKESPASSLDQSLTREAISDFEHFVELYPNSTRVPEVNEYIDQMQEKLMMKDYDIAYGYYWTEQYHAAYISLKNFINLYPDSPKKEDAMFYVIKSGYIYATNSREDKMKERLEAVVNDFNKFATTFQDSKHIKESQDIYTKCQALLATM